MRSMTSARSALPGGDKRLADTEAVEAEHNLEHKPVDSSMQSCQSALDWQVLGRQVVGRQVLGRSAAAKP